MPVNEDDFRDWVIQSQVDGNGRTQEEREKIADEIIRSWDLIEEDSIDLHNAMPVLWNHLDSPTSFVSTLRKFTCVDNTSLYDKLNNVS